MLAYLTLEIKSGKLNKFENILLKIVGWIVAFLVTHKKKFVVGTALIIPVVLKPNYYNKLIGFVLVLVALSLPSVNANIFFSIALAFWAYTQLNTHTHKLFILCVCVILVILNVDLESIENAHKVHNITADPYAAFNSK